MTPEERAKEIVSKDFKRNSWYDRWEGQHAWEHLEIMIAEAIRAAQTEAIERCEELVRSYCPKPAAYGRFPDRELPSLGGKLDMLHQILSRLKALKEEG